MIIGILGCGEVGNRLAEMLNDHEVWAAVKDLNKQRSKNISLITTDPYEIVNSNSVKIIVEAMSDKTDSDVAMSKDLILQSLKNKKNVLTCNKKMFSKSMYEFLSIPEKDQIHINSMVSNGPGFPKFADTLTMKNILSFDQQDIFCFRGGGPHETAEFLYKEICDIIKKEEI
jgi:homoserine dehydrogenase